MIRNYIGPYSASSALSPDSHSSLSPTVCCCANFFHLLTAPNCAGVSWRFGCVGLFGFQAPGGSTRHFSSHFARFLVCFAILSAVACVLHALYSNLRSLRALEASLLLSLAALTSWSASNAKIHWEKYMWWFSPHVVIFVADFTTSANHHMYLWWFLPQVQITTNTCGSFHHKCKSPQVFIVILFEVGSKVREHYECIVDGGNMFNSMCPWYLVCNTGTFSDWENTNQKRWNDMRSINTGKGMQSNCLNQQTRHMAPHVDSQWCHTAHCHEKDMSNQQQP